MNNKDNNLIAIKNFFEKDMKIKEILLKIAPEEKDEYDEDTRIRYLDKLDEKLNYLEDQFLLSIENFDPEPEVNKSIIDFFNKSKETLIINKYSPGICRQIFQNVFSNMDERLIENVKEKCVGYTLNDENDLVELIENTNTVNELLHVLHSYITNNHEILQAMPILSEKEIENGQEITLYGEENEIARKIYYSFPKDIDVGKTDIISLKNKILLMIRDRGHALSIDIDTSKEDDISVRYFVPKLCNKEMIEKLPGINKKGITNNGATGFFVSKKDNINKELFSFIEKVPTDLDMETRWYELTEGEIINLQENETQTAFHKEDIKDMLIQRGEKGRKKSSVIIMQERIREIKEKIANREKKRGRKTDGRDV